LHYLEKPVCIHCKVIHLWFLSSHVE
jgi:hypothetical protein